MDGKKLGGEGGQGWMPPALIAPRPPVSQWQQPPNPRLRLDLTIGAQLQPHTQWISTERINKKNIQKDSRGVLMVGPIVR